MTGGKSVFKGCCYQTLVFMNSLLDEDSLKGELEEGDDFVIYKKTGNKCCQSKDYNSPVKKKDISAFLPNFIRYYKKDRDSNFIIFSPFGTVKTISYKIILEELKKKEKISDEEYELGQEIVPRISETLISDSQIKSELKNSIADIIKGCGCSILSKETWDIIMKIMGELMYSGKEITREEIIEMIIKEAPRFVSNLPKEAVKNSSDLVIKYDQEGFKETEHIDSAVHKLTIFFKKKKTLSLNPSLLEKFSKFYGRVEEDFINNCVERITITDFKKIILDEVKKEGLELENFFASDPDILDEMYNSLIGGCTLRPKK